MEKMEDSVVAMLLYRDLVDKGLIAFNELESACNIIEDVVHVHQEAVTHYEELVAEHENTIKDLKEQLLHSNNDLNMYKQQMETARNFIDVERKKVLELTEDRNNLREQLAKVRDVLNDNKINNETKERLSFLNKPREVLDLKLDSSIKELDATDQLLSDLSVTLDTLDEEDTENVPVRRSQRLKRASSSHPSSAHPSEHKTKRSKKLHSHRSIKMSHDDHIVATTTLTVPSKGPVSATSVLESLPSETPYTPTAPRYSCKTKPFNKLITDTPYTPSAPPHYLDSDSDSMGPADLQEVTPRKPLNSNLINTRTHSWLQKAIIKVEECNHCHKKIKFSKVGVKCRDCKAVAHVQCRDLVPLPCVPVSLVTPTAKAKQLVLREVVPQSPPLVPPLLIHCIKEIEARGLTEVGLYRVPGSDREVKSLKERLLKAKGVADLSGVGDIHVVCGCLKDFLRGLQEPLVTAARWFDLMRAADVPQESERRAALYKILSDLPRPNRDTLAYLVLHLQRVVDSPEVKMSASNLAKMFGPSVIGYSTNDPENMMVEMNQGNKVMCELIELPSEVWEGLMDEDPASNPPDMRKTPSANSLFDFLTTPLTRRKIKFFDTPDA